MNDASSTTKPRAVPRRRQARAGPAGRRRARVVSGRRLCRALPARFRSRPGSPASRSAPSMPRSSPAIRKSGASARLKEFWELVSSPVLWRPIVKGEQSRSVFNEASAACIATFGVPGFFTPRVPPAPLWPRGTPQAISYYDTAPLRETLESLVDFELINEKHVRLSVGAVNVRTGNFAYFDNTHAEDRPRAHHGLGRAAAGISAGRDRRRVLLGRRPRLEHAARLCARSREERRPADLPGRPVQRARRGAGLDPRGDRAREGHPLFQPHAADHRRQQEAAQHAKGAARADRAPARTI